MDLSRREFLRGAVAGVALAAVPAGFVRLASGLVVPDEEALEREAHRKIWQVASATGVDLDRVGPGSSLDVTLADGRKVTFGWKSTEPHGLQPLPQMIAQAGMITSLMYAVLHSSLVTPVE